MTEQKKPGPRAPSALNNRQRAFVAEYLVDLNATQAAIRAGYSVKTAEWQGPQLLGKTHVAAAVQQAMQARQNRTEITQDRVLKEIARLAFFDIRKLVGRDGKPLPVQDLDDDTAAAIAGLEVAQVGNAMIGVGEVLKFKLADKNAALEKLAKHLGLFEKDNKQQAPTVFSRIELVGVRPPDSAAGDEK